MDQSGWLMVHVRCNPSSPKFEPPWLGRNGCGMTIYVGMLKCSCGFGSTKNCRVTWVTCSVSLCVCVYFIYIYICTYIYIYTYIHIYTYTTISQDSRHFCLWSEICLFFLQMSSMWFQILLCALFIDRLTCSHTFCPAPGLQKQYEMGNITNFQPKLFIATCSE